MKISPGTANALMAIFVGLTILTMIFGPSQ